MGVLKKQLKNTDNVYDDIVDEFKIMDDAPYELDAPELRNMQKMEHALRYILDHLTDDHISMSKAAKEAELSPSYFERDFPKYFGMPFIRFVTELRIRKYARDMLSVFTDAQRTTHVGFATPQSFSKAFRRVIGVSPIEFRRGQYDIPDMPERKEIEGIRFNVECKELNAIRVKGTTYDPPYGNDTYYLDTCAYTFRKEASSVMAIKSKSETDDPDKPISKNMIGVGAWWYFPDHGMKYVFGPVRARYNTVYKNIRDNYYSEGSQDKTADTAQITIQGGKFAVFSYLRPEHDEDIPLMSRILMRFIFKEWIPINHKKSNTLGCTYELFDKDKVYIMVPLASGSDVNDTITTHKWSIAEWATYIDDHITDSLSLQSLAYGANYSPQNYRDIFLMYYGITPTVYIKRRRAYLALRELSDADAYKAKSILRKYHFRTREHLDRIWQSEFGENAERQVSQYDKLPDLVRFYEDHSDEIRIKMVNMESMQAAVFSISQNDDPTFPADTVDRIIYWLNRDFKGIYKMRHYVKRPEEKIFFWGDDISTSFGYPVYMYYGGNILIKDLKTSAGSVSFGGHIEEIAGGEYAEFSLSGKSDLDSPRGKYQFLTRMAFGGWINRNRWRTDFSKRTFIIWRNDKMYFYVPVVN